MVAGVAAVSAAALAAMSLTAPVSGQEPEFEDIGLWDLESEIDFKPREPVPGRRLYYEELRVSGDRAHVTLRAATGPGDTGEGVRGPCGEGSFGSGALRRWMRSRRSPTPCRWLATSRR